MANQQELTTGEKFLSSHGQLKQQLISLEVFNKTKRCNYLHNYHYKKFIFAEKYA